MFFSKSSNKNIREKVQIDTAIGIKSKYLQLTLYDKSYSLKKSDDFKKFLRSLQGDTKVKLEC